MYISYISIINIYMSNILGWFKKTQFSGNQLLFNFFNLYVEKKTRKGCDLYDDI